MSALSIQVPFPVFQDRDGQPLDNGYVWLGTSSLNPQTNPVVAYYDSALTIVATQPLRTLNGFISRAGSPAQVYVDAVNFSILVQDRQGTTVFSVPEGTGISPNASGVVYDPAGTGAVATTVQSVLRERVSVFSRMTAAQIADVRSGAATLDVTAAVLATINYCLATSKKAYFPNGSYLVSTVAINNAVVSGWSTLDIEGDSFETGSAMSQTGYGRGTTIVTNGTTAFTIAFNVFNNESIRFKNISFYNKGAIGTIAAIIIDKTTTTYPRGWSFEGMGYYNFDTCIGLRGNDASIFNNFIGSMTLFKQFPYQCGIWLQLIDAYANLCHIDDSLIFSCSKGGIALNAGAQALGSGAILSIRNTHFEGCNPAGIIAGALTTFLTLDNVSGESTGTTLPGYGLVKRSSSVGALTLTVSNSNYGEKGFALMPTEYRLGRGDVMTASCPVNVSGWGWQTTTPQMVTPVVSNNATYGQTDVSTFCMTPVHSNVGRTGKKAFDKFNGWNAGANINYSPAYSGLLPNAIRSNFVGAKGTPVYNISDGMTAPSNGYFMASWIANYTAVDNGFQPGSDFNVYGTNRLNIGNSFGPYEGNFLVITPVSAGQDLVRCSFVEYVPAIWTTGAYVSHEPKLLNMFEAACGYPKTMVTTSTVGNGSTYTADDYGDGATPYAVNVKLLFDGGALGYYEYLVSGDGAVAANKSYTLIASRVVAGIAVTTFVNSNVTVYYIEAVNTAGSLVTVTKEVAYLS